MPQRKNNEDDFWAKVDKTDGCWLWTGAPNNNGYGQFMMDGVHKLTHQWSWIFTHGEPPVGQINHRCGVPACVNPDHLYDGTQRQNVKDAVGHGTHISIIHASKTHCPQGHPYDEANTSIEPTRTGVGRKCRTCHRERQRERYRRKMQDPAFREAERLRAEAKNRSRGHEPRLLR